MLLIVVGDRSASTAPDRTVGVVANSGSDLGLGEAHRGVRTLTPRSHPSTMSNFHRLLSRLPVNRQLLQAVVEASRPCCALGSVEERRQRLCASPRMDQAAQLSAS